MPATPNKDMQKVLDAYKALDPLPIANLSPENARMNPTFIHAIQSLQSQNLLPDCTPEHVEKISHKVIPGSNGDVFVRLYMPKGNGPHPVVMYIHGGGWVIFDLDVYDSTCRSLCNGAECMVVSVGYRQAPEYKFPTAHEDCFTVWKWLTEHASEINGDPHRMAVAGESVGGNMAASVCLMAKERGVPMPIHQLLAYPITQIGLETQSYKDNVNSVPLNTGMAGWFGKHYLNSEADAKNPMINILNAPDHSGLPTATIITAEIDPLATEGEMYAQKLRDSGVEVEFECYKGVTHEFMILKGAVADAHKALAKAADRLKQSLRKEALV